ncbi:collagen alpha-1(XIV) chain-like [Salvelinus fontinalis]|uniref:collagen alpha-1(XIV) chain-like n=1 Tax=Salvelinus fontinalis TaxID=8038 RepID=UPI0024853919|nr:collagen alpha-1(XIV) chain-like [Salvelinus fontinalis]
MLIVGLPIRTWCPLLFLVLAVHFPAPAQGQVPAPRRLRFKVLATSKLHVSWKEPKGNVDGYRVLYHSEPGEEKKELRVSKGDNKVVIQDFDAMKEYHVRVLAVRGNQQSRALQGKYAAEDLEGEGGEGESTMPLRLDDTRGTEEINEISGGKTDWMDTWSDWLAGCLARWLVVWLVAWFGWLSLDC